MDIYLNVVLIEEYFIYKGEIIAEGERDDLVAFTGNKNSTDKSLEMQQDKNY
jgi:hypothetical protein